jgi:hypothetical protein
MTASFIIALDVFATALEMFLQRSGLTDLHVFK